MIFFVKLFLFHFVGTIVMGILVTRDSTISYYDGPIEVTNNLGRHSTKRYSWEVMATDCRGKTLANTFLKTLLLRLLQTSAHVFRTNT
jgi:hypothetical protein